MKKNVIVFGLISGCIVSAFMVFGTNFWYNSKDYNQSMLVGYGSMLLAFSFVFVGIKNFRDKHNGEIISFWKGFKIGLYISLISSTVYVITWLIEFYCFIPDFMDKYTANVIQQAKDNGATPADIEKQLAEMAHYKEMYKNPLFVILLTYMEILPLGIVVSLISALILKKKSKVELGKK